MKQLKLRSFAVQLVILFVAAFMLFELGALGYRYFGRSNALTALEAVRVTDHIAVIRSLIDRTPHEQREVAIEPFQGSDLYVYWLSHTPPNHIAASAPETDLLRDLLMKVIPQATVDDLVVGYEPSGIDAVTLQKQGLAVLWQKSGPFSEPVGNIVNELAGHPTYLVSVRLSDGEWLNFLAAYVDTIDFWPLRSLALLFLLIIGVVGLSIWAIQRLTSPFRVFAAAAARLARDVNASPIKERGPSEVRNAVNAFNTMQERLQHFVEDRTKMLAAVSHDLRTPITRLRLRAECVDDQALREKFMSDLKEMEDMISGVLTFAKEDGVSEPTSVVELRALLQSICDDLNDRGYKISLNSSGRAPYACRRVSIRRCFANVLENAVKYGCKTEVSLELAASEIRVIVDDSGPGIPESLQEEVFRPFYRLDTSRSRDSGGSGLGLTVARTIARAHGGDVLLTNRCESGKLRATIILPGIEAQSVTGQAEASEAAI